MTKFSSTPRMGRRSPHASGTSAPLQRGQDNVSGIGDIAGSRTITSARTTSSAHGLGRPCACPERPRTRIQQPGEYSASGNRRDCCRRGFVLSQSASSGDGAFLEDAASGAASISGGLARAVLSSVRTACRRSEMAAYHWNGHGMVRMVRQSEHRNHSEPLNGQPIRPFRTIPIHPQKPRPVRGS